MGRWAGWKTRRRLQSRSLARFVQWVVDTFQLSIKRARLSGRNCLTTYPGEEKHDRCSRVDSRSVAALFLKDCPASLPRAGYATAVSPTKMPYELASMRVT